MVEARLNQIKTDVEDELARERDLTEAEIDRLRFVTDQEIDRLREETDREVTGLAGRLEEQRNELLASSKCSSSTKLNIETWPIAGGNIFEAAMGAEALRDICVDLDLNKLARELRTQIRNTRSKQVRKKAVKRLRVVESLRKSNNRPNG